MGDECFYWIYAANIWGKYVILRITVWGMNVFHWIYAANILEYVSCRVSVGPPGPWLGNVLGDEFVLKVACPKCRCPQRHVLYVVCPQCPIGINIRLTWCLI